MTHGPGLSAPGKRYEWRRGIKCLYLIKFFYGAGVVEVLSGDAGCSVESDTVMGQVFFDEIGNLAANM